MKIIIYRQQRHEDSDCELEFDDIAKTSSIVSAVEIVLGLAKLYEGKKGRAYGMLCNRRMRGCIFPLTIWLGLAGCDGNNESGAEMVRKANDRIKESIAEEKRIRGGRNGQ